MRRQTNPETDSLSKAKGQEEGMSTTSTFPLLRRLVSYTGKASAGSDERLRRGGEALAELYRRAEELTAISWELRGLLGLTAKPEVDE